MKRFLNTLFAISILGIAMLFASPASSHSQVVRTFPESKSVFEQMPEEFRIEFNEDLLLIGEDDPNKLIVRDQDGNVVSGPSEVAGPFIFAKPLPQDFAPGKFFVEYRVASADGHIVSGKFDFQIRTDSGSPASGSQVSESPIAIAKEDRAEEKTSLGTEEGSEANGAHSGHSIHAHSDHIAMGVIALIAIGSWFLYRKINDY